MDNRQHLKLAFEGLKQKILTSQSQNSDFKNRWIDNTVTLNKFTDRHIADIICFNFALSNEYLGALLTEINSYAELHTHILDNIEGMPFSQKNFLQRKQSNYQCSKYVLAYHFSKIICS